MSSNWGLSYFKSKPPVTDNKLDAQTYPNVNAFSKIKNKNISNRFVVSQNDTYCNTNRPITDSLPAIRFERLPSFTVGQDSISYNSAIRGRYSFGIRHDDDGPYLVPDRVDRSTDFQSLRIAAEACLKHLGY